MRYCETLGRLIGIVDFELVFDLVLHLNGDLIKDLKINKSFFHDYVSSICSENTALIVSIMAFMNLFRKFSLRVHVQVSLGGWSV